MIKTFARALLAFLVVAAAVPTLAGAKDKTCDSLVVTGHPDYPPVAWGTHGKILGAAPALVSDIAKELGVKKVTSKNFGSWGMAQEAAKHGHADVIFGIYKNDERMTYLHYIDPAFMLDPVAVVVRQGASFPFAQWSDLKGRKGVTNAGESYGNKFDAYMTKELTVAPVHGVDEAFHELLKGHADYLIIGLYPGENVAKRLRVAGKVTFLPQQIDAAEMFIAFSKKSKCYEALKAGFAEKIQADVASGKVKALLETARHEYHQ